MADNKGVDDTEPSINREPAHSAAQENVQAETCAEISPAGAGDDTMEAEETEPRVSTPEAGTATVEGSGDANNINVSGGCTSTSSSSSSSSAAFPTDVSPAAAAADADAESSPAEAPVVGDVAISGLASQMSPPPTAPATPPAPINLLDTCAVCKQKFHGRECQPKLLPCLHSFCLSCIPEPERQISVQMPGSHGQSSTHIVNIMRCSLCHQDYKQIDIIDNYLIKDTSDATGTAGEKAAQVCTSCEDNAGTIGFCMECGEWLCKTCVEAHQRVKITKDHKIRTREDPNTAESVGTSGQRPVFCPTHKQEPLKLFCETCDTLTCRDCQLLEHKEHRYQFLEEAHQNHKAIVEATMTKLHEKKSYVHYSVSQVQNRLKELEETHKKVEHEIKIAVFTLINEINKKGKSLLQQLETVTKERTARLMAQHKDTTQLARQIQHVLNFCQWAISTGSSTALLYSKRPILFQLRQLFKARLEPVPMSNGEVRFFCDPTFWAKNVVNLGNLIIEKTPPPIYPANMMGGGGGGGGSISPGQGPPSKNSGQINLAQLRLQHMQQAAIAQKQQHLQQHQQHQQQQVQQQHQQQQQMRLTSQMSQQHSRQTVPSMVQQQPPRLINLLQNPRGPIVMTGGHIPPMYSSSHHMRLPGPSQGRIPTAQPRLNGQQYTSMMQPHLQRQMSLESEMSHQRFRFLLHSGHSNPGHAGPFPVASGHNANPTSPTSASMAGAHAHCGPGNPVISPIELIPSVTNPENLPCLPEIPPIQLEDAGSSNLGSLLTRYIAASTQQHTGSRDMNPSPGLSIHSPGSSGLSNAHTPARPSSTSSTGSRGSCSSGGKTAGGGTVEPVRVKQEPGSDDAYECAGSSTKIERGQDSGRSSCMLSSPESRAIEKIKVELESESPCSGLNGSGTQLTNGCMVKGQAASTTGNPKGNEDDPNEDWCAVCINGGDLLLCCDRCPRVFHRKCHVPTIEIFPKGDFLCTFCRSISTPEIMYCDESKKASGENALQPEDQRKCERLLLYVFCHELSVGFREPVPSSVPNYYRIIKHPMDLKKVKRKLQRQSSTSYNSIQEFVCSMRRIFQNCAKYNEDGSEMAVSGKTVSLFFEDKLKEVFPGQSFPEPLELEAADFEEHKDGNETEDSEDDFIPPRRKRLKVDGEENLVHIK
ncbi:E3 ubiquitin-protein ligase TRIM33 isoform X2 [Stigmatopora argus]